MRLVVVVKPGAPCATVAAAAVRRAGSAPCPAIPPFIGTRVTTGAYVAHRQPLSVPAMNGARRLYFTPSTAWREEEKRASSAVSSFSFLDLEDEPNTGEAVGTAGQQQLPPPAPSLSSVHEDAGKPHEGECEASTFHPSATSSHPFPPPPRKLVTVRLHNLPKNWMHEEIVEFIHAVGEHAGIAAPEPAATESQPAQDAAFHSSEEVESERESSAIPHATSPHVHRLRIPFGRRTGLIYGEPQVTVTTAALADYLVHHLNFSPDDFRSRIYFTVDTSPSSSSLYAQGGEAASITSYEEVEESVERERTEALRTLELDRYLMAPDLLLDIAKLHQRRLVTANEKVLLDSFLDAEGDDADAEGVEDEDEGAQRLARATTERGMVDGQRDEDGSFSNSKNGKKRQPRTGGKRGKKLHRRAGDLKMAGRGSLHNTPIPKPYVAGRSL